MEKGGARRAGDRISKSNSMNAEKRYEAFSRLRDANPSPTTELNHRTHFELLIAVVLSAQSTDRAVNQITTRLFARAPDPQSMLELGVDELREEIKSIGLFNSKANHIIQLCRILIERYDGDIPSDRQQLESLPGVGRKTANVILNTAFEQPTIAVDTHIFRISNRMGLAPGKNVAQVEQNLLRRVPKEFLLNAHHWLILHGRYTCTAKKPRCHTCIIFDLCEYSDKMAFAEPETRGDLDVR